jgi:hypothetical protein
LVENGAERHCLTFAVHPPIAISCTAD